MANSLEYDFFFFMESDNLFDANDFSKLDRVRKLMFERDKKMSFFKYHQYTTEVYETLIFGGDPYYFLEKAKLPINIKEYIDWVSIDGNFQNESLERSFYKKFDERDDLLQMEGPSELIFCDSVINKYSLCEYLCDVFTNNLDNRFILFFKNYGKNCVNFKVDGVDNMIDPDGWSYRYVENNTEISVLIYIDGEIVSRRNFSVNEQNRESFSEKASISFK
jgi:hypothetical protein